MEEKLVNRENILSEAVHRCYKEMYANAQPPADFDELVKLAKEGKEDEKEPFYEQHYLNENEFKTIIDKYVDAYGMHNEFKDHCDIILNYFDNGIKDKWIEKDGDNPGYRGYEQLKPLKELIGEEHYNIVVERVKEAQGFFRFNHEESSFGFTVGLGCAPTSNKDVVIDYWKRHGEDIEIKERSEDEIYYRYYEGVTDYNEEDYE